MTVVELVENLELLSKNYLKPAILSILGKDFHDGLNLIILSVNDLN